MSKKGFVYGVLIGAVALLVFAFWYSQPSEAKITRASGAVVLASEERTQTTVSVPFDTFRIDWCYLFFDLTAFSGAPDVMMELQGLRPGGDWFTICGAPRFQPQATGLEISLFGEHGSAPSVSGSSDIDDLGCNVPFTAVIRLRVDHGNDAPVTYQISALCGPG